MKQKKTAQINKQPDLQRDMEFIFEMGALRNLNRLWVRLNTPEFANHAEHIFRVCWIALLISAREGGDSGKIVKMALVHDIDESRATDVDIIARQYSERKELLAIGDILSGTAIHDEFRALWEEYSKRESLEAKIVKDADNLDVDFELAEQAARGNNIAETKKPIRDFVASKKLYTETAKSFYAQLPQVSVHDWWMNSDKNRRSGGDWKS